MGGKNEENWQRNYAALREYIAKNGRLPSKWIKEDRGLLNWWKYNRKCRKAGKLSTERCRLLDILLEYRQQ